MACFYRHLLNFFDIFYLPKELLSRKREFLLHISDTPSCFYRDLGKMIDKLEPLCVVHSGDLADEIKLELRPGDIELYRRRVKLLSSVLEDSSRNFDLKKIIALGNHDDCSVVKSSFRDSTIIDLYSKITLEGWSFCISHYASKMPDDSSCIGLYGHDLQTFSEEKGRRFNGLKGVNLFSLKTGEVFTIPYPRYIDNQRQLKRNIGL